MSNLFQSPGSNTSSSQAPSESTFCRYFITFNSLVVTIPTIIFLLYRCISTNEFITTMNIRISLLCENISNKKKNRKKGKRKFRLAKSKSKCFLSLFSSIFCSQRVSSSSCNNNGCFSLSRFFYTIFYSYSCVTSIYYFLEYENVEIVLTEHFYVYSKKKK